MKRALLLVALLVAPALFGQPADRAMLLAPNGTLYTVESKANNSSSAITSTRYLTLSVQNGATMNRMNVPASITGGNNWQPELAFDDESNTLFVFWLRSPNSILGANELLFCSFQNGKWNASSSIDDAPYHFRSNLRVGMTRTVQVRDADTGGTRQIPALSVHAAWWDVSAVGEVARYAMLTIERGVVTDIYRRDLPDFINRAYLKPFELDEGSREVLRHPVIFESPDRETVDLVFGDMTANTMHRLTLRPVMGDTRVRIPIGVRETSYPGPKHRMASDARISAISTPPDRLVLYYLADGSVKYLTFEAGTWSREKSITMTEDVSAEAAVSALRRLVRGD